MEFKRGAFFSNYIDTVHERHNYEKDFWKLAHSLDIPVEPGRFNRTGFFPRPVITLEEYLFYSPKTYTKMHEICHVLLVDSGVAEELWANSENPEEYRAQAEAYCNFGAAQLQITNHELQQARRLYGDSPRAILHMLDKSGVIDPKVAARRLTFGEMEDDARRAAFMVRRGVVRDQCSANLPLPFKHGDLVKDLHILVPDARLLTLDPANRLVLGTVVWD